MATKISSTNNLDTDDIDDNDRFGVEDNVFEYMKSLPEDSLHKLYGKSIIKDKAPKSKGTLIIKSKESSHSMGKNQQEVAPWVCKAVFQSRSMLAKQIIMRLLCFTEPISRDQFIEHWFQIENKFNINTKKEVDNAIRSLLEMKVLESSQTAQQQQQVAALSSFINDERFQLNESFRNNFKVALASARHEPWKDYTTIDNTTITTNNKPTTDDLNKYMHDQFGNILDYLLNDIRKKNVDNEIISFLDRAGLKKKGYGTFTSKGFQFLLKDIHVQMYLIVAEFFRRADKDKDIRKRDAILSFLLQLSFCKIGECYPINALHTNQKSCLALFSSLGLIYIQPSSLDFFYPTELAINMIYGASSLSNVLYQQQISIIVQTNFKLIAYTDSNLYLTILSLFLQQDEIREQDENGMGDSSKTKKKKLDELDERSKKMMVRLPNMIIGNITRDSMKRAFDRDITAKQILDFLETHAHKEVIKRSTCSSNKKPIIPDNISSQLLTWEEERTRVRCTPQTIWVQLDDIPNKKYFQYLCKKLSRKRALVWYNKEYNKLAKYEIVVSKTYGEDSRSTIELLKEMGITTDQY